LLRVIAGLEEANTGEILIDGKDVSSVEPKDRDIAMIFRSDTLYPSINVYENMAFGLKLRKTANAVVEQRVKAAAEILGLSDVLMRKPKALTAEQKQKTALGRAIVREPKLYLLDDPIAGLDDALKSKMRNVIISLQTRMQGTFIYATKNVNEALTMATRVIVMREGFIQQIDTPANLYDYPANAYVAFFVGSPSINFINNATLSREGEEVVATFKGGKLTVPQNILARFTDVESYLGTGKKVILGIRPEDMKAGKQDGQFTATVSSAEKIAGKLYADCDVTPDLSFVALSDECGKGDEVNLSLDLSHLYVFDADTRLTLLARDEGYCKTDYADADFVPLPYGEEESIKKQAKPKQANKKK
ncbi:MAG: ABC transporter ATP-binding protein, partial [Candidatus Coproplasma sp.]